jgi:hypothetical protein
MRRILLDTHRTFSSLYSSADLEITVNMLIQIDKLVQLLESPVFTCKISFLAQGEVILILSLSRSSYATTGTRAISLPLQMLVWNLDASPSIICLLNPTQSSQ